MRLSARYVAGLLHPRRAHARRLPERVSPTWHILPVEQRGTATKGLKGLHHKGAEMTTRHIYVDETKARGYVVVASNHLGHEVDKVRKELRTLVLRGQSRIHMAKENDSRRKAIIDILVAASVTATVYDADHRYRDDRDARTACLQAIINDVDPSQPALLVIEQDDSLIHSERQQLVEMVRAAGRRGTLHYQHHRAKSELMLAIPDAIAWCWAKGGDWRRRVSPITTVKQV